VPCQASPTARGSSALVTVAGRFAELLHRTRIYPIPSPLAILPVLVLVLAHCMCICGKFMGGDSPAEL
jgi:hypothetical protein